MGYIVGRLVKNFSLDEMMNDESKEPIQLVLTPEVVEFAQMMQELRDRYKKPINVSSWYRTRTFNNMVGGYSASLHLIGRACDILHTDYKWFTNNWLDICKRHNKTGGINYYNNYIHLDNNEDAYGHKEFVIRDYRK